MYIPKVPDNYIERHKELESVVNALTRQRESNITSPNATTVTAALQGAGGFGKSTLAIAVCSDERVIQTFPDGIYWVELGEKISKTPIDEEKGGSLIAGKINQLLKDLGQDNVAFTDYVNAMNRLREVLLNRRVLIVIDDVWNKSYLEPFLQVGLHCAHLVTTRESSTLPLGATIVYVDSASPEQALQMLCKNLPDGEDDLLHKLAQKLWNWPLLLSLANGQLNKDVYQNNSSLRSAIERAILFYESRGLTAFDLKKPMHRNQAARLVLDLSIEQLTTTDQKFLKLLSIFPENTLIPLTALKALLGRAHKLNAVEVEVLCGEFASASFIQNYDAENGTFRIHAVIHNHLVTKLGEEETQATHRNLIDGYLATTNGELRQWWQVPDDQYYFQHLIYHLLEAKQQDKAIEIFFNYSWLKAELMVGGVSAVISDCESLAESASKMHNKQAKSELHLLRDFFRLSANILTQDTKQLPSQILGRLLNIKDEHILQLIAQTQQEDSFIWLNPCQSYLTRPGGNEAMTLDGHSRPVTIVSLTLDERRLISGSDDDTVKVWDLQTGDCTYTLKGHNSSISAILLTHDGNKAVTSAKNGTFKVWDLKNGLCLQTFEEPIEYLTNLVFAPERKYAVWGTVGGKLNIWTVEQENYLYKNKQNVRCKYVKVLADEDEYSISITADAICKIWDLERGKWLFSTQDQDEFITAEAISADGKFAMTASNNHTLSIWDIEKRSRLQSFTQELENGSKITATALSVRGGLAGIATDDSFNHDISIWDAKNANQICILKGHEHKVQALSLTPDEKWVISASNDRTLKIWNLATRKCFATLKGHSDKINTLVVSGDGKRVFSGSRDKTIKVWNLEAIYNPDTSKEDQRNEYDSSKHTNPVNAVIIDSKGKFAISASQDETIKIWEIESGKCLSTFKEHTKAVNAVALTLDGSRTISGDGDGTIICQDLKTGKFQKWQELRKMTLVKGITNLKITPDGAYAISGNKDSIIDMWAINDGLKHHRTFVGHKITAQLSEKRNAPKVQGITSLAVTLDGTRLISAASDCTLKVWDLTNGNRLRTLREHNRFVADIALTPDSKHVVSASYDTRLKIWDIESGKCIHTLKGHKGPVRSVILSIDGKKAISASSDSTLRVWDIASGVCLKVLSGHTDRVNAVALNHDGNWIASAANDKSIRIWDAYTYECLLAYKGDVPFYTVDFNKSLPTVVVAGDHKGNVHFLRLMNIETKPQISIDIK